MVRVGGRGVGRCCVLVIVERFGKCECRGKFEVILSDYGVLVIMGSGFQWSRKIILLLQEN